MVYEGVGGYIVYMMVNEGVRGYRWMGREMDVSV